MAERNSSGGNLTVAIIIAIIVGVVVFFLIDSQPAGQPDNGTVNLTGDVMTTGEETGDAMMTTGG